MNIPQIETFHKANQISTSNATTYMNLEQIQEFIQESIRQTSDSSSLDPASLSRFSSTPSLIAFCKTLESAGVISDATRSELEDDAMAARNQPLLIDSPTFASALAFSLSLSLSSFCSLSSSEAFALSSSVIYCVVKKFSQTFLLRQSISDCVLRPSSHICFTRLK